MISYNRRRLLGGAALGGLSATLLPGRLSAQVAQQLLQAATPDEVKAAVATFLQGAEPSSQGMQLAMEALGANPAAVPVKVVFDEIPSPDSYCEELIVFAEGNPHPEACRFTFTPLAGTTEVAMRLRLIDSQSILALARMSDGRYLQARQHITVVPGACGM